MWDFSAPPKEPKPERVRSGRHSGKTTPTKATTPEPSATEEEDTAPLPAHLLPPEVKVKDEGRKPDMPKAPIIFVAGRRDLVVSFIFLLLD